MRKVQLDGQKRMFLATVMTAALLGACSSDVTRFGDDPFSSPFKTRAAFDPVTTNSINRSKVSGSAQRPLEPVANGQVTTQALPVAAPPMMSNSQITTGSVSTSNYPALATVAARQPTVLGSSTGWSAVGGTPVTLQQGDSLNSLSSRYGVPVSALMAVNGLSNANQAQPGQQIMIPAYSASQGGKASSGPVANSVIQRAQPMPSVSTQATPAIPQRPAQTASAIQAMPSAQPAKVAAAARQITPPTESDAERRAAAKLKEMKSPKAPAKAADDDDEDEKPAVTPKKKAEDLKRSEDRKTNAEAKIAEAKATEVKAKAEAEKARAARIIAAKKAKAEDDAVTTASIPESNPAPGKIQPGTSRQEAEKEPAAAAATSEATDASFRWPAKGRVISGFGARGTGGANDGINIALPEGTPVRAAESGTVVHADDALKGYGKLVLIRHPNGFVSVYAHNGELNVKRGESVKRGQMIAKSGQSGNVTAPQLHFEIRKGATPVDPTKHLGD